MNSLETFQKEFIDNSRFRMDESLRMINVALDKVSEDQIWQRPNGSLNSIGNLILHLCGNITQYGITSLQSVEDNRDRNSEFSQTGGLSKTELIQKLTETVEKAKESFKNVETARLLEHKEVQGFDFSGIGNIIHVVEHFSYHTGQIAFWVKMLNDQQLGFYDGIDLTIKNKK